MSNDYKNKIYSNRYKVLDELPSQNDFEFYFKGKDLNTDKNLQFRIIPIYKDNPSLNEQSHKFISKEINMLRKLNHRGLPVLVESLSNEDENVIITEYREGRTLESVMTPGKQFSEDDTMNFLLRLLPIMQYLHSQEPPVIYRDLQPKNIFIDANGELFLTKYEAARTYKADKVKDTVVVSTRGYNPPEQALGKGQSDPRSDIYSIGMITFQMLTGKDPTASLILPKISDIRKDLSPLWTNLVAKATNIKQDKRYASCEDLLADLHRIKSGSLEYNPAQGGISGVAAPARPSAPSAPSAPARPSVSPARPDAAPRPRPGAAQTPGPRPGMPPVAPRPNVQQPSVAPRPGMPPVSKPNTQQPPSPRPSVTPAAATPSSIPDKPLSRHAPEPAAQTPSAPAAAAQAPGMSVPEPPPASAGSPQASPAAAAPVAPEAPRKGMNVMRLVGMILFLVGVLMFFIELPMIPMKTIVAAVVAVVGVVMCLLPANKKT